MNRAGARSRRRIVLLVGLATLGLVAWGGYFLWSNRVELFFVPGAWTRLRSVGPNDESGARLSGEEVRERFTEAAVALVRVQEADLPEDAELMRLERFRSLEGLDFYLACFKTSREWYYRGADGYDTFSKRTHRILDSRGRLVDVSPWLSDERCESSFLVACGRHLYHGAVADDGLLRFSWPDDAWGSETAIEATFDANGFVYLGESYREQPHAPVREGVKESTPLSPVERVRVETLLSSSSKGDRFRGLDILARHGADLDLDLARPFLKDADDRVRARAFSIVDLTPEELRAFVEDPSPRLRLATLFRAGEDGESIPRALADDSHVVVWKWANHYLACLSEDDEVARRAFVTVLDTGFERKRFDYDLKRLSSPETAATAARRTNRSRRG